MQMFVFPFNSFLLPLITSLHITYSHVYRQTFLSVSSYVCMYIYYGNVMNKSERKDIKYSYYMLLELEKELFIS